MRSIFKLSVLVPLWQTIFAAKLRNILKNVKLSNLYKCKILILKLFTSNFGIRIDTLKNIMLLGALFQLLIFLCRIIFLR